MQLTVLVDNNTLIDRYFLAEPGLSFLIEDEGLTFLFDTGYSDIFIKNAQKMGKNLAHLNFIILSHSHLDHTWGLDPLIRYFAELEIEHRPFSRPALVAHPESLTSASAEGFREFGSLISKKRLAKHFDLHLSKEPQFLTGHLIFLGEIPRTNDFEGRLTFGRKDGATEDDNVIEDSALVYKTSKGLIIITGCSHAGICNIIEYAKKICNDPRILDVIGGFHLQNPPKSQIEGTISYFKNLHPAKIHACHCTDLESKIALSQVVNLKEVGVGLSLQY
ncbi:MAG: MBL fold metallo-hydrolase [Desulfobacula sp.]|uniref:MBL fold metallo-hydrolase n=1 Tax=Desulfobacula sp. TaxID=2593537 RepID=UPI0025C3481C|nr:MBL fold metallo-hydrolase [Desulfobacula sp.]MCD4719105.1 MBL fold metallo-hydrolase [Desulfobacula sp.]